ncbi:hypothetical protein JCGZ_05144 [Jatropha curcas]|uniref:Aminotransferase-like plant mobile domain-containing protein n=1 Tax=Jatropha curcas TaxID=180498 RepID=A0A067KWT9_JATCU|nr:hypothetical protein JCGZ_05144 [Jatropha curcas]
MNGYNTLVDLISKMLLSEVVLWAVRDRMRYATWDGFRGFFGGYPLDGERRNEMRHLGQLLLWCGTWNSFGCATITSIDFAAITGLSFGGRSVVFDDRMRTLDYPGLQEMPWERVAEMDVDVVTWAYLFYLLSATLFMNYGNNTDLALLPPPQDLDATRPVSTLFGVEGNVNAKSLPRGRAWRYSKRYSHTTSDIMMFRQLLNRSSWDWVSVDDYNKVCQLYEATRFKLAVVRLSDEHIYKASTTPPAGRGRGAQRGGHACSGAGRGHVII